MDPKTGRPPPGWLAEEQIDGQRYHTLVSLLDGAAGGERATLDDPERTKDWWEHLPRTAAWADRYGGKFDQVKKLIDDAIEAKRRSRRNRRLTAALGVVIVLGAGRLDVDRARKSAAAANRQEKRRQEDVDSSAMTSAKTLLEDVLDSLYRPEPRSRRAEAWRPYRGSSSITCARRARPRRPTSCGGRRSTSRPTFRRPWTSSRSRWRWRSKAKDAALSLTQTAPDAQRAAASPVRRVDPRRQCALRHAERPHYQDALQRI